MNEPTIRGRGAAVNPPNRFEAVHVEPDPEAPPDEQVAPRTRFLRDASRSVLARNDSPDLGFEWGLNPYRGCEHGCSYCYARPYHEYLGMSAGLDFETKVLVKEDAPELLRDELSRRAWKPALIAMSGVTDCYQPAERRLGITRRCLEVLADFANPVQVITKNHLVTRDADVLARLAAVQAAAVFVTIPTLDGALARTLEPRASTPSRRLEAISRLAAAGVPVGVMIAPVIPGLTEHEILGVVKAAAAAGASFAGHALLRLPGAVEPLFLDWIDRHVPEKKSKILSRIRETRGGKLDDGTFGRRMRGAGVLAEQLRQIFGVACRGAGISTRAPELSTAAFRIPRGPQLELF